MEGDPSPQSINQKQEQHRKPISRRPGGHKQGRFLFPVFE